MPIESDWWDEQTRREPKPFTVWTEGEGRSGEPEVLHSSHDEPFEACRAAMGLDGNVWVYGRAKQEPPIVKRRKDGSLFARRRKLYVMRRIEGKYTGDEWWETFKGRLLAEVEIAAAKRRVQR